MAHHHIDLEKAAAAPCKIANPGPLGLFSFASTTFILSMYNVGVRGIATPNVVVGMAVFCGGLAQLLAGMWEFAKGNAFGATAFTSYGAFWMSYATILLPGSGVISAYKEDSEFASAVGIYLMAWFIVTVLFTIVTLRKSVGLVVLFAFLSTTFLLLGIGALSGAAVVTKSGGFLGVLTAFVAFYIGLADLLAADNVHLPTGKFN